MLSSDLRGLAADLDGFGETGGLTDAQCRQVAEILRGHAQDAEALEANVVPPETRGAARGLRLVVDNTAAAGASGGANGGGDAA